MHKQTFRLRNNLILNILFSFSSVTLALFGFLAVLPPASEPEASAIIDGEQFALTITNSDSLSLNINPTDSGAIAMAKDTITANTNSPAGYKLYVSTDSSTSNDIHLNGRETNNTADKKLTATLGTNELPAQLENNSWGFAIAGAGNFDTTYNTENPSNTSKFAAVPQKDNEQLIHDHEGRATDDEVEIYFAAKANTDITSGNYKTTILYTTLSESTDQDQTEINVEDGTMTEGYTNKTAKLKTSIMLSRTPTLKVKVAEVEAEDVEIINERPLELSFTVPENLELGNHDVELTIINLAQSFTKPNAIEVKPAIMNMQDMTPELCSSLSLEEQTQFKDARDDKVYWVAKLKDGNCWMTQNLDYDLDTNVTLTPRDSDVTENWTPSHSTIRGAANLNLTNWVASNNTPSSFDSGDYYFNGVYTSSTECNYITTTCSYFATTPYDLNGEHGHVGNYYNWSAAVASNDTSATTAAGTDMSSSICPKGWRLPHGNQSSYGNDFEVLNNAYGGVTSNDSILLASPLFFIRSGILQGGSSFLTSEGKYGLYWSSTSNSDSVANNLVLHSASGNPLDYFNRSYGISIRCVARGPKEKTMQNIDEWRDELEEEQQIQVKDERDGKTYWVAKLKDGNIWMTQNLDYDLSVTANQTLAPETSNVTTTRTITPSNSNLATWGTDKNATYYLDGGDYYYADGITKTAGLSNLPADDVNYHYAQGDYYSWKAATAGVGTTDIIDADVNESICPSGWRLPTSNSNSANYSFGNLVKQYGYTGNTQSGTSDSTLLASPLFFARGGYVVSSGSLHNQGSYGEYWSSRASGSVFVYSLYFTTSSYVDPSARQARNLGNNIRCVAE